MAGLNWNTVVSRVKGFYQNSTIAELKTLYAALAKTSYQGSDDKAAVLRALVACCFPTIQISAADTPAELLAKVSEAFNGSTEMLLFPCPKGCGNQLGFAAKGNLVTVTANGVTLLNDGAQIIVTCPVHGVLFTLK